jgi:hypothetical protein
VGQETSRKVKGTSHFTKGSGLPAVEKVFRLNPNSGVGDHARPRALLDAPSRPASGVTRCEEVDGEFRTTEVFREGSPLSGQQLYSSDSENNARGGRAPNLTSEFGFK